ncbi:MAG: hypothetical protein NXI32_01650 [bacterium]|nr:hypothetical protein [bacterium]
MTYFTLRKRFIECVGFGMGFSLVSILATACVETKSLAMEDPLRTGKTAVHQEIEAVDMACARCAMEAAAYATAVANLEAAQAIADDAYEAYRNCINPGPAPGPSKGSDQTATLASILEN